MNTDDFFGINEKSDGTKFERLQEKDITFICGLLGGTKWSKDMALIYENQVPRQYFNTEELVRGLRFKILRGE